MRRVVGSARGQMNATALNGAPTRQAPPPETGAKPHGCGRTLRVVETPPLLAQDADRSKGAARSGHNGTVRLTRARVLSGYHIQTAPFPSVKPST